MTDDNGNVNCVGCTECYNCTNCFFCTYCNGCKDCILVSKMNKITGLTHPCVSLDPKSPIGLSDEYVLSQLKGHEQIQAYNETKERLIEDRQRWLAIQRSADITNA